MRKYLKKERYDRKSFFSYGSYLTNGKTTLHKFKYEKKYGNVLSCFQLHHKDGNIFNNKLSNLELVSFKEHRNIHKRIRIEKIYENQLKLCFD